MKKLLVINFLIKLIALKDIFNQICGKYGQATLKLARNTEQTRIKIRKLKDDIKFLLVCKRNELLPKFARPKFATKMDWKTRKRIGRTIIDAELKNKHQRMKELKRKERENLNELRITLGYISYCTLNKKINMRTNGKSKAWRRTHEEKLKKLFAEKSTKWQQRPTNIVHNFSSYDLTAEETHILSFGLDHQIPAKMDENMVKTEFEAFYYHLDKQLRHLTAEERDRMKTKIRNSCENYYQIKHSTKVDEVIAKLAKNKNVMVLKQDKGRGVVLMDRSRYIEKCMEHLNTDNFKQLKTDNTKAVEDSIQNALYSVKDAIGEEEYRKIYPSGSNPGKFYGTAKVHKLKPDEQDKIGKLPLRPIISNIGTATHKTAQYLCRLLAPLGTSKYTAKNTKEFVEKARRLQIPDGYQMISFDVVSLFTNVPLKQTIDIILRKVYEEKLIKTKIPRKKMEKLLNLCTQGTPFMFNGKMYVQIDGVMMGSPLGALFANIFMCELENTIVPQLGDSILHWTRYVDDTFAFIKPEKKDEVRRRLDSFHEKISFTHEDEKDNSIAFLDVAVTRGNDQKLETSVYRKPTNTDVYMNWYAHAPAAWKIATLTSLVKRAVMVSSTTDAMKKEIDHLKKVFTEFNDYPEKVVNNVIENELQKTRETEEVEQANEENEDTTEETTNVTVTLSLPYAGAQGEQIMRKMKRMIEHIGSKPGEERNIRVIYTAKRLGTKFPVKDKTPKEHLHNVVYHAKCPNKKCESEYTGETRCRTQKRVIQHNKKDKKSHLLIHANETKHRRVWMNDFEIVGSGYSSNFKRKISESLFIKKLKPDLNVQKESLRLSLYN